MAHQFVDNVNSAWQERCRLSPDLQKLEDEYDSAILGVAENRRGVPVVLYAYDAIYDLLQDELVGDESLDENERDDRCHQWTSRYASAGDEGHGDPLVLDGPFDEGLVAETTEPFRFYKINGEYWRGEILEDD